VASGSLAAFTASATNESDVLASIDDMIATLVAEDLIVEAPEVDTASGSVSPWTFAGFTLESFSDLEDILGLDPIHEVDPNKGWPTARA
jgi:hypothetical protein